MAKECDEGIFAFVLLLEFQTCRDTPLIMIYTFLGKTPLFFTLVVVVFH